MGAAGAAAAPTEARTATARPAPPAQRHALDPCHRRAVARPAGTLWPLGNGGLPILPLGAGGRLADGVGGAPAAGGCAGPTRLVGALRGWDGHPRPPARSRCPARQRGQDQQALGRSRGGFSTKLHVRTERGGKPLALLLTAGERHEQSVFVPLMQAGAVKRPGSGRGRPRRRPQRLVGDKGYSSRKVRGYLRRHGIGVTIPTKRNERPQRTFDRELYRERNQVERCINRLKQFRRVATRYEKLAVNFLAMVTIAAILIWL